MCSSHFRLFCCSPLPRAPGALPRPRPRAMALSPSLAGKLRQWRQKFLISYVNLFPPTFVELSKLTPSSSTSSPSPSLSLVTAFIASAACRSIKLTFILWIRKNTYEISPKYMHGMHLYRYLYLSLSDCNWHSKRACKWQTNWFIFIAFLLLGYFFLYFFPSGSILTQGKYASGWHNICIKVGF